MTTWVTLRRRYWNVQQLKRHCTRSKRAPTFMANYSVVLPWKTRWRIAVGAARGLRYLHEYSQARSIVQRNNVTQRQSVDSMASANLSMETSCFLTPEYANYGSMTDKSDVFTFGVMLLELITGRKAVDTARDGGPMTLMEWAQPLIQAGNTMELVDPRLNNVYDPHQLNKMINAAGRCINVTQLPTMSEVLQILERKLQNRDQTSVQPVPVPTQEYPPSPASSRLSSSPMTRLKLSYDMMLS